GPSHEINRPKAPIPRDRPSLAGESDAGIAPPNKLAEVRQAAPTQPHARSSRAKLAEDVNRAEGEPDREKTTAFLLQGDALYNDSDFEEAVVSYSEAIQRSPNRAEAYNNRGNAYLQLGHDDYALESYTEAIRLDPNLAAAFFNRGVAYYNLRQY